MAVRWLRTFLAVLMVLWLFVPGMKAQKSSKPLTEEDVIGLLTGDVPPERVAAVVREQGVSFELTPAAEDQIRQAGGNDELLKAIRELAPKPPASSSSKAKPGTTEPRAAPPILLIEATPGGARVYIDDEPVGTTSPEGRLKLITLSPGAHRVRLAHRGFQDYEKTVQLTSGETTRAGTPLVVAAPAQASSPVQPVAPLTNPTTAVAGGPAYLGVRPAEHQPVGTRGVVISAAAPGGPADRAGLKARDTIVSIGGRKVRTPQDLETAIAGYKAGEKVEITWSSGGSVTTKSIRLSARPAGAASRGSPPVGEKPR